MDDPNALQPQIEKQLSDSTYQIEFPILDPSSPSDTSPPQPITYRMSEEKEKKFLPLLFFVDNK